MWGLGDWQRPKDLLEPLLEDSEEPVGLGQTWRGSRGRNSAPDLERGLETAVTAVSDPQNGSKATARKEEVSPTGGEISKIWAAASSNLNSQSEFLVTTSPYLSYLASYEDRRYD